jgi:hypothetical protein
MEGPEGDGDDVGVGIAERVAGGGSIAGVTGEGDVAGASDGRLSS